MIRFAGMLPILFNWGGFSLSSFGFFLFLSLAIGMFTIWRLGKLYEVDDESLSNLTLISFLGGLIGARILSVILNLDFFNTWEKIILLNKYPGLSLWGGLIGGFITVFLIYRKYKLNPYQVLDFLSVGVLIGLVIGEFGCFIGGCNSGIVSNLIIAFPVIGLIGNRLAISLIEATIFLILFRIFWRKVIRFHIWGGISGVILLEISLVFSVSNFLKDQWLEIDQIIAGLGVILGAVSYYLITKKSLTADLRYLYRLIKSRKKQSNLLEQYKKSWNNLKVSWSVAIRRKTFPLQKIPRSSKLRRLLNVKPTPEHFS